MLMLLAALAVQPLSVPVGEVAISAIICVNNSRNSWDITVFITTSPEQEQQELIQGSEIDTQLINESGTRLTLLQRPSGSLAETGGGLGTSTTASFEFQRSEDIPRQLLVTYQGQTAQFNIIPTQEDRAMCE
ncbi:hypothetical protein [Limnofasciculus baicalensis]|uniref:Uncharacterized protein n=1 Tax=Limnofasciculus baicalensis BBK-W-15 TaxID=2699891 RepID=A0AAE3KNW1_9CYAN|nr:hypothetical protein [Limnofasciculus baicalensis]MCP2729073.1 hypothetical protein [Limnofasciculus baicalensis BBK-W-15]